MKQRGTHSTLGALGQGGALRGAMAGALVVAPVNFAVLPEQATGVFLDVAFQFLQGGGGATGAKVFVHCIGCPERNLDVPLLVPQQVRSINPPLRPQHTRRILEIDPARCYDLDVEQDGAADNDPDLAASLELVIPRERPLGDPVVLFAVVAVDRATAVDHLPQLLRRGTGDLIRLILALHRRRCRDMRCRNQADQNGISKRNHHDRLYPPTGTPTSRLAKRETDPANSAGCRGKQSGKQGMVRSTGLEPVTPTVSR